MYAKQSRKAPSPNLPPPETDFLGDEGSLRVSVGRPDSTEPAMRPQDPLPPTRSCSWTAAANTRLISQSHVPTVYGEKYASRLLQCQQSTFLEEQTRSTAAAKNTQPPRCMYSSTTNNTQSPRCTYIQQQRRDARMRCGKTTVVDIYLQAVMCGVANL